MKKRFIMSFIALAVISMAIGFVACKKNDSKQSKPESSECVLCTYGLQDLSETQKNVVNRYIENSSKSFSDIEILGASDLMDETEDWTMIAAKDTKQNGVYKTFFCNNDKEEIECDGTAIFEIVDDNKISNKMYIENTILIESIFDVQIGDIMHLMVNDSLDMAPTIGEDTHDCYRIVKQACSADPDCSTMCDYLSWEICNAQIFLSCWGHHLKAKILKQLQSK